MNELKIVFSLFYSLARSKGLEFGLNDLNDDSENLIRIRFNVDLNLILGGKCLPYR